MVHPVCELVNTVATDLKGKTLKGRTPFEVCIFDSQEQWDYLTAVGQEKELPRKTLVARFGSYGDAHAYAARLVESKMYFKVLLRG